MADSIKNAPHYEDGRKYKPRKVIRDWGLNFNLGSAVKYIARAGRKDDIIQDLKKAQEYLQFEIEALEEERHTVVSTKNVSECIPEPIYDGCSSCEARGRCHDAYKPNAVHCGNYNGGNKDADN